MTGELCGVEQFYTLFVVVVTQIYTFDKMAQKHVSAFYQNQFPDLDNVFQYVKCNYQIYRVKGTWDPLCSIWQLLVTLLFQINF